MNKLGLLTFSILFICGDFMPLEDTQHFLMKRSTDDSNSTMPCNETLGNCNNITLNNSSKENNLTSDVNTGAMKLNLTEMCQQNVTLRCNGSLVDLSEHCNNPSVEKIVLHCHNESSNLSINVSLSTSNVSLPISNVSLSTSNVSLSMSNVTLSTPNSTLNSSVAVNSTAFNITTVNGTIRVAATNLSSLSTSTSNTPTPNLSVTPSSSSIGPASSIDQAIHSSVTASSSVKVSQSAVKPSTTLALKISTTVTMTTTPKSTTPMSTTPKSTTPQTTATQSTSMEVTIIQSTISQKETSKPTEPILTTHKSTTKLTTTEPTKEKPTADETKPETTEKSTFSDAKTEQANAVTKMENPFNSEKNIKFFYVNVLIPVGIGVCGALLIAFSVLLFKCCRRNKVKKVRYFGKPKGYSRNNMDHMNLLANSSDEE